MRIIIFACLLSILGCHSETETADTIIHISEGAQVGDTMFLSGNKFNGLLLEIRYLHDSLEIQIRNNSDSIYNLCSHINQMDLDWYYISLINESGDERKIFVGEPVRTASQMHTKTLNPQESFSHKIDLQYWAKLGIVNQSSLSKGKYLATVSYETKDCYYPSKDYWNGKISAGPLEIKIE